MYKKLENFINEIIIKKPELRELINVLYNEADENKKKDLQDFLEAIFYQRNFSTFNFSKESYNKEQFDKNKEELKNRSLQVLNSESLEVLNENINELLKKYPALESQNLLIFDELRRIVREKEESAPDDDFYNLFLQTYPELKAVPYEVVGDMFLKITCIYPKYKDLEKTSEPIPPEVYPFFMLVAHYLCIEGKAEVAGFNQSAGVVSSSSIDGVSVSYVAPPLKDSFQYFFSKTPYGQEYLAYIGTNNVMMYV